MRANRLSIVSAALVLSAGMSCMAPGGSVEVILDSSDGSSSFVVYDSGTNAVARIRSDGAVGIKTNAPQASLHVRGDAIIGTNNAPRFGMQAVSLTTSGVLFRHPTVDISLLWNSGAYALTVTNGTGGAFYDAHILMSKDVDVGTNALGYARDLNGPDLVLAVTNAANKAAGYTVTVVKENERSPGFIFQGAGWNSYVGGLVTYWY